MISFFKKYEFFLFSALYWVIASFIIFKHNGTGGEADSIHHYLIAKYSFQHPELLIDHWAKPLFTLLAAPFAQLGFTGMKYFNALCVFGASFFLYRVIRKEKLPFPILAPIFYFLFPISFTTTFSGFTEPLCALALTLAVSLFQQKRYLTTAILISFTPFIRSEGLLFIGVLALFLGQKRQWKALAFLGLGHVVYTLIGYYHHQDILWVFTKIPYAYLSSHYGSGDLFHFAEKLNYLMGIPLLIFFILGILRSLLFFRSSQESIQFISLLFLAFFIAHSLFWYLEIFNSMGLKRVFAAVSPLMAFFCWYGFCLLGKIPFSTPKKVLSIACLLFIFIFPFTSNPAAMDWKDLDRTPAQQNAAKVADYIHENGISFSRLVYTDPYLCEVLRVDPFDFDESCLLANKKKVVPLSDIIIIRDFKFQYTPPIQLKEKVLQPDMQKGDLVIWDNWHAVIDYGVQQEHLSHLSVTQEFTLGASVYKLYLYHPSKLQ